MADARYAPADGLPESWWDGELPDAPLASTPKMLSAPSESDPPTSERLAPFAGQAPPMPTWQQPQGPPSPVPMWQPPIGDGASSG